MKHDKKSNQFIGLPKEWQALLEDNNINFQIADKEAALEAICMYNKVNTSYKKQKSMKFSKKFHREENEDDWDLVGGSDERIDLSGDELEMNTSTNSNSNMNMSQNESSGISSSSGTMFSTFNKHVSQTSLKPLNDEFNMFFQQKQLKKQQSMEKSTESLPPIDSMNLADTYSTPLPSPLPPPPPPVP